MLIEVLTQIALLPVKAAQAVVSLITNGTAETINLTVTIGGRKVGLETRVFLFDQAGKSDTTTSGA